MTVKTKPRARKPSSAPKSETRTFDRMGTTDRLSRFLDAKKLVPKGLRGTDEFLDLVSWNIAWFDHQDPDRIDAITDVLDTLNADAFVLLEVAEDGALEEVSKRLADRRAGFYSVAYGKTGGQQRVTLMWDRDWVRAKEGTRELFANEELFVPAEHGPGVQKVFPRLPLWGYFEGVPGDAGGEGFTFELAGVHMKAQGPAPQGYDGPPKDRWGIPQRKAAAARLARWLQSTSDHLDTDVIIAGDWNAIPTEEEWQPLRELENANEIAFRSINGIDEISHLVRLNAGGPVGSRIDLQVMPEETLRADAVPGQAGLVIKWKPFDDLDALSGTDRKNLFARLKKRFSDHLPVVSRFYLTPPRP